METPLLSTVDGDSDGDAVLDEGVLSIEDILRGENVCTPRLWTVVLMYYKLCRGVDSKIDAKPSPYKIAQPFNVHRHSW